ncbi:hypothetical protein KAW96_05280 [candidate division WOR-3 bacterium]|nr:hypothetical protein [candidate division WOR-3 bacterium]
MSVKKNIMINGQENQKIQKYSNKKQIQQIYSRVDRIFILIENITACSIGILILFVIGAFFIACFITILFGQQPWTHRIIHSIEKWLKVINQFWKVLLILIIPLFYRPLKKFVEEAEQLWPLKRKRKETQPEDTEKQTKKTEKEE